MANLYRVRAVSGNWGGAPGLNTFYFWDVVGPASPISDTVGNLCTTRVRAAFTACAGIFPAAWGMDVDPNVDVIDDETGDLVDSVSTTPLAHSTGAAGGQFGPQAIMLCAQLRTADIVNSHRVRGRSFLGPVKQEGDADGTPAATSLAAVVAFGAALLSDGVLGPHLQVWHRPKYARNEDGTRGALLSPGQRCDVTSITAADRFAVLRSRRA